MTVVSRLKVAFQAARDYVVDGYTLEEWKATLTNPQKVQLRSDLEAVALVKPMLIPIILFLDSGASVAVECWKNGDTYCRLMSGKWLRFGPGEGGIDANGNDITCTPGVGEPWANQIPHKKWNDFIKFLKDSNDELAILDEIKKVVLILWRQEQDGYGG